MHLDRDDLGRSNDVIRVAGRDIVNPLNQEIVSIRGIQPGEYVVNLHLYRAAPDQQEVPATVKVEKLNPRVEVVFYGEVLLVRPQQERTAVRFAVAADGKVAGVNQLAKELVPLRRTTTTATEDSR
jgi:hypothetical protein